MLPYLTREQVSFLGRVGVRAFYGHVPSPRDESWARLFVRRKHASDRPGSFERTLGMDLNQGTQVTVSGGGTGSDWNTTLGARMQSSGRGQMHLSISPSHKITRLLLMQAIKISTNHPSVSHTHIYT